MSLEQSQVLLHACKIDRFRKQVYTTDLQSREETVFDYDSLVIPRGARAVVHNIKGVNRYSALHSIPCN